MVRLNRVIPSEVLLENLTQQEQCFLIVLQAARANCIKFETGLLSEAEANIVDQWLWTLATKIKDLQLLNDNYCTSCLEFAIQTAFSNLSKDKFSSEFDDVILAIEHRIANLI